MKIVPCGIATGYGCKPVYVWGLIKHGVKSFTDEQIKRSKGLIYMKLDLLDIEQNNKDGGKLKLVFISMKNAI